MGACLFRNNADGVFVAGDHQSTFSGNPLACAAGLVVLDTITSRGFLEQVTEKGIYICSKIKEWNFPCIKEIRGKGLMIGIQLSGKNPLDIKKKCLEEGLCVTTAGKDVIRFLPPLTISDEEIKAGLEIFKTVLEK